MRASLQMWRTAGGGHVEDNFQITSSSSSSASSLLRSGILIFFPKSQLQMLALREKNAACFQILQRSSAGKFGKHVNSDSFSLITSSSGTNI